LDEATAQAPDLILLAVMMLIMDGFTVCHILKGNDKTRMIPIVIMTALDGFDDRIKGIEAGADDFLTKPVNQRELLARIQTTLKLKHTSIAKSTSSAASKTTLPSMCLKSLNGSLPPIPRLRNCPGVSRTSPSYFSILAPMPA
jgi:DNA-binding response OmpR family regulator